MGANEIAQWVKVFASQFGAARVPCADDTVDSEN